MISHERIKAIRKEKEYLTEAFIAEFDQQWEQVIARIKRGKNHAKSSKNKT